MKIPDNVLQEIAAANDIVETVSSYLSLKKGGKDFKGLCPFHNEKTPSFTVSPTKQIFHCFGCGTGGDVIGFVMKMEKMEFPEALDFLAQKKGIDLSPYKGRGDESFGDGIPKARLYQINQAALEYFRANLKAHTAPQEYLKKRGLTGITARDFSLGWGLSAWDGLMKFALEKGFSQKELLSAGLILESTDHPGRFYDRFRGRVIFPLFDTQDRVIAFSGRVLDDSQPKYINSPETAVFHKGSTLFGLNMAKDAILKTGWVAVCEGPMDMIGVYQAGIQNFVASQGTAFTQRHAKLIKRFTTQVVLCFDGDAAGQMAGLRSLDAFLAEGMEVKIAVLPAKEDPDSYVRANGAQALLKLLAGAADFVTFRLSLLKKKHDLTSETGKANAAKEVLADLAKLPSVVHQNSCIQKLAELLGVREEALWMEFKKLQGPGAQKVGAEASPVQTAAASSGIPAWEMDWTAAVLQNETLLEKESLEGHYEMLSDPLLAGIIRTAAGQWRIGSFKGVASVSILFRGQRESEVLAEVASRPIGEKEAQEVYEEGMLRFRMRGLELKIRELSVQIERQEKSKADTSQLLVEISHTKKELLGLSKEPFPRAG